MVFNTHVRRLGDEVINRVEVCVHACVHVCVYVCVCVYVYLHLDLGLCEVHILPVPGYRTYMYSI